MSSKTGTGSTNAGVKKQTSEQRDARKKQREEIQRRLQDADEKETKKIQDELEQFDRMDLDEDELVKKEPDDAGTSLDPSLSTATSVTGGAPSGREGMSNATGSKPVQSVEGNSTESPVDLDFEPTLIAPNSMGRQDDGVDGVRIMSVARRTRWVNGIKTTRDFINMHGPQSKARYTIDEMKRGTMEVDELVDVTDVTTRRIDHPKQRATSAQYVTITAVAWEFKPSLSMEARLDLLNPLVMKLAGKYPSKKLQQKAANDLRKIAEEDRTEEIRRYPPTTVRVQWTDHPSTWETSSAVKSLFPRHLMTMETDIHRAACRQEEEHQKWLNKEVPGRDRSPTAEPSKIRETTPEPLGAQVVGSVTSSPQPGSVAGTPAPAGPASLTEVEEMLAYADTWKEARQIPKSTVLSQADRMKCITQYQVMTALAKQMEGVTF
jgi:hypothetical protein